MAMDGARFRWNSGKRAFYLIVVNALPIPDRYALAIWPLQHIQGNPTGNW
ncbi:hypothetical protein LJR296_000591 [Cupriavidus necator]